VSSSNKNIPVDNRIIFIAEITGIAAADLVHDFLSLFLTEGPVLFRDSPKDEL
jgi:hypothetical protein